MEILLLLKFSCPEQKTFEKMRNFVDSLYDNAYIGVNDEEGSDEEEASIFIETDQSKPLSHMANDQSKLVEEEDLHVDVNFVKPIDLAIN